MPIIEGIDGAAQNPQSLLYDQFLVDISAFLTAYQTYISTKDDATRSAANAALTKVTSTVNSLNQNYSLTVSDLKQLNELKSKFKENADIITDARHSTEGDLVIKKQSSYYYNSLISIFLACGLFFAFSQVNSSKL
jgi:ABC-type transporter Mla subunit MlaD